MVGSYCIFWPMHYMGLTGLPRRYYTHGQFESFNVYTGMNEFITVAAFVVFMAQMVFVFNFFYSMWKGRIVTTPNPWKSNTLEWTTPIIPGHGNWEGEIPTVHRWAYDYSKDGEDHIPQNVPLREGEVVH